MILYCSTLTASLHTSICTFMLWRGWPQGKITNHLFVIWVSQYSAHYSCVLIHLNQNAALMPKLAENIQISLCPNSSPELQTSASRSPCCPAESSPNMVHNGANHVPTHLLPLIQSIPLNGDTSSTGWSGRCHSAHHLSLSLPLPPSLSLSLSHTHTHTPTHTESVTMPSLLVREPLILNTGAIILYSSVK